MLMQASLFGRSAEGRKLRLLVLSLAAGAASLMIAGAIPLIDGLYIFPALLCLLLVIPVPRGMSLEAMPKSMKRNNVVLGIVVLAAASIGLYRLILPTPTAYRVDLDSLHRELETADRTGDSARAANQFRQAEVLLRKLNDDPAATRQGPVRFCMLAASHAAKGLAEVSDGGRWTSRDRFAEASKGCV